MTKIITQSEDELTIQVTIKLTGTFLEMENNILDACNEVGCVATGVALKNFDADGAPILVGNVKMTSKGESNNTYQTPYGPVDVNRHTYQTSEGGKIYCPLEEKARIIHRATPKFAQQLSHKYANLNAPAVRKDLMENHHRTVAHSYIQDVSESVGAIAQAKEEVWEYATPLLDKAVKSIGISLDGAYILMREDGYRETMVGSISLYGLKGERLHTIYIGEAPEYGKGTFFGRFEQEIARVKQQYPDALYVGVADGAKANWSFLEKHTNWQLLDFFHASEYLSQASYAAYPAKADNNKRETWLDERCSQLKHKSGAALELIQEMEVLSGKTSLPKKIKADLTDALRYFKNHSLMMDYARHVAENLPIGSGVIEAACKTLVKQRLCCAGMRWKETGAKVILSLRALVQSDTRWQQFWDRINRHGAVFA